MLNNKKGKLGNYLEVSNRTNQFQIQVVIEWGNPLLEPIEQGNPLFKRENPKQVHLLTARVSTLKWHMIERGNPLLKHTQEMCQHFVRDRGNPLSTMTNKVASKQC